ncbi:GtrA family protein [Paenibacillus sp. LHD-117]|uniref:GtrA family protein n=1 Tax=Paenibacillus sp. LHD-117 TaxID=3071412 RepID=UPI0027E1763B|nr:GtrA family protein [Paenibacillus sp. LHD-117]MDQ6418346.1 GtrA family protein [Paenibacillus sp. LHD-117]
MAAKPRDSWFVQFVMFGAIGVLNTAIDFGMFALLTWLSFHYAAAQAIAYLAGMANSYLLNNAITFRSGSVAAGNGKPANWRRQLRFLVWNGVMLLLSIALMGVAVQLFDWSEWAAKLAVTLVILGLNFYGSKKWVFAPVRAAETGGQT